MKRNNQPIPFNYDTSFGIEETDKPDQSSLAQFVEALKQGGLDRA